MTSPSPHPGPPLRVPITGLSLGLVATLCLAFVPAARALDPATPFRDYQLRRWNVEHGLPQISVQSIAQDSRGYIWVGTQGGVARFDGLHFVTFNRTQGGVDTTLAVAALVDAEDRVWFGTPRGAVRIERGVVTELRATDARVSVRALALDADGGPLFATERGVLRAAGEALVPHLLADLPSYSLLHDADALWVGGDGVLVRVSGDSIERFALPVAGTRITQLKRLGATLLLGTNHGVFRYYPTEHRFEGPLVAFGDESVEALLIDHNNNIWIGGSTVLMRIAPDGGIERIANDVLDGRPWVNALFEDREATLWIGTRRESLYQARDGALRMRSVRDGLDDPLVWSVLPDGDGVLVGSNSGLTRLGADGRFAPVAARGTLPQKTPNELSRSSDGSLWIGTRAGITRLARGALATPSALLPLAGKQITGVLEIGPDDRWIATLDGLFREHGGALETVVPAAGLAANRVRCLLARGPDELWIGTEDGVRVVRGGAVVRPEWAAPLDGVFVTHMLALPDGRVLIATLDSGLGVQRNTSLNILTKKDGLPSSNGWALDLVDGQIYVGSLDGIWRVPITGLPEPGTPNARIAAQIVAGSGYRDNSIRGFACCNGGAMARSARLGRHLYYPSTEGVVRLDTTAVAASPAVPAAIVESLVNQGTLRHGDARFEITATERNLSIDYTAVAFVRSFALEFRYKLEGYDPDWIEAGERRTAFYTHLPHGDYRFVVQARTPNEAWGAESPALELSVVPLWHERTGIRVIALLLGLALLAGLWEARLAQLRARQAALESAVAERTRELARANERLRVANQTLALENQTDPLTGLYNRRFILNNALRGGAGRATDRCAVLMIEIDEFKALNERHGFASGDRVLVELGALLVASVRGGDIVARWSGVSFLVCLPGLDESGTLELAERIRSKVTTHIFLSEEDSVLAVTATIGFAQHASDEHGEVGLQQTLDLADAALQRAKRLGRNRVIGLRRLGVDLPPQLPPAEIERLVAGGRLVWIEHGNIGRA